MLILDILVSIDHVDETEVSETHVYDTKGIIGVIDVRSRLVEIGSKRHIDGKWTG